MMENLLPRDGIAQYYGKIVRDADFYFSGLERNIAWQRDEVVMFGKKIVTKRLNAWYADDAFAYAYSGTTRTALPWTPELLQLRRIAEEASGEKYNSCLLNLYHDGSESMGWHSDDEKTIARDSAIASMSFGAERKFSFKHKRTRETVSVMLENGSLLVMKGQTQRFWLHAIPKMMRVSGPRINLTFRSFEI